MNTIIEQTKKTISEKREQMESMQQEVNNDIYNISRKVKRIYDLKQSVFVLETEVKEFESQTSNIGCIVPRYHDNAKCDKFSPDIFDK